MGFLSNLFGKKESEVDRLMRKIWKLIKDEDYQNSLLNDLIKPAIINGANVDKLSDATGHFGFEKNNPIPVNGAIGEIAYLSQLETHQGEHLLFHRIGAINKIDVFEAVTYSGSYWSLFFLAFFHPRRSRLAPEGLCLGQPKQFSGFNKYCSNFPYDFPEKKESESESGLSMAYIPLGNILPQIKNQVFQRTDEHLVKINTVKNLLTTVLE